MLEVTKHEWRKLKKKRKLIKQCLEAVREIGVLLMAFTPLDIGLSREGPLNLWRPLVFFFAVGFVLFVAGVILDVRYGAEDDY